MHRTKSYKVKLKPLSPIHIGTGEAYEPMNYVVDRDATDNVDRMYIFDEFDFVKELDAKSKEEFIRIASNPSGGDALLALQGFIKRNANLAKKVSYRNIQVLKGFAEVYNEKVGTVAQREGGGKKVINQLIVEKTLISPNLKQPIIPGSSLKGAIATAFGEMLFKGSAQDKHETKEYFKNFLVADSSVIVSCTFIADAINIKRNKASSDDNQGIKVNYEVIDSQSEFNTIFTIKESNEFKVNIKDLIKACNSHYMPIFTSQLSRDTDKFAREAFSSNFIEKCEKLKLADNQFLLRVGKHSGARAVTIDGMREIKIMQGKGRMPSIENEETTVWLINKQPFGWLHCEILEEY
ncbi:MAG: RAMP superfamily CRISPR-associated protein [Wolinella sp.]